MSEKVLTNTLDQLLISGFNKEKERSVLTGLIIGAVTLIPFIYITLESKSVVLMAEAFRSGNETFAIFLSWMALLVNHRYPGRFRKLEQHMAVVVGVAMLVSAGVVLYIAFDRFKSPQLINMRGGLWGAGAALFSAIINGWLWRRNLIIARNTGSSLMIAQWNLFRSKFLINCCVLATMLTSMALTTLRYTIYLDSAVSVVLAIVIISSAIKLFTNHDKSCIP